MLCCRCFSRKRGLSAAQQLHWVRWLGFRKVLAFLCLLGAAGGCAYAMVSINTQLGSQGEDTVGSVKVHAHSPLGCWLSSALPLFMWRQRWPPKTWPVLTPNSMCMNAWELMCGAPAITAVNPPPRAGMCRCT